MIHACNQREWYVYEYLIPSLVKQGIQEDDIKVWHDYKKIGNLQSFVASMKWISQNCDSEQAIWHLQDDIVLSKNFKQEVDKDWEWIVSGFVCVDWNPRTIDKIGRVPSKFMWYSFQCMRIPNYLAGEFCTWFYEKAVNTDRLWQLFKQGKHDDEFWRTFIYDNHIRQHSFNLKPNIVDHIDWMIGWSIINDARGRTRARRSFYWEDNDQVRELEQMLREDGKYVE